MLRQILFPIRSWRCWVESIDYNGLSRGTVGLAIDDPVWDHSTCSQNRDCLFNAGLARVFFERVRVLADGKRLTRTEQFSVDGTRIDTWASHKSFRPKNDDGPSGTGRHPEIDKPVSTPPRVAHRPRGSAIPPAACTTGALCSWRTATAWWWRSPPLATSKAECQAGRNGRCGQGLGQGRLCGRVPQAGGDAPCGEEADRLSD